MLDTRRYLRTFFDEVAQTSHRYALSAFVLSSIFAFSLSFLPSYEIEHDARVTLFILLFAAGLWISEAIPAFAVSLLVMALEIVLLGFNDFDFQNPSHDWQLYLQSWSSPLLFLFLAGFIMASAASKTKLDIWMAKRVLFFVGSKPSNIISGIIAITFTLSMFISNTATAAMMMGILTPLLAGLSPSNPFGKAILLSVLIGANLGGMATIIGTPPNAIAVGILGENAPSFLGWIGYALPPALLLALLLRLLVLKLYPSSQERIDLSALQEISHFDDSTKNFTKIPTVPSWKKAITILLFSLTLLLWLSAPLHHIPTTVVSLIPIIGFTLFGIIDADDICKIRWDVIILIIGGLALGQAVHETKLDVWFATLIPAHELGIFMLIALFSYIVVVISNFMSNTAAANIVLPIVAALALSISNEAATMALLSIALSASFAMSLPVSTPPNAIIYASNKIASKEFLILGISAGALGPLILIAWFYLLNAIGAL